MLAIGLPRLCEDGPGLRVDEVWLVVELFQVAAHLTLLHDVDVVGFVSLREKFAASDLDHVSELLVKCLELLVLEHLEGWYFP